MMLFSVGQRGTTSTKEHGFINTTVCRSTQPSRQKCPPCSASLSPSWSVHTQRDGRMLPADSTRLGELTTICTLGIDCPWLQEYQFIVRLPSFGAKFETEYNVSAYFYRS